MRVPSVATGPSSGPFIGPATPPLLRERRRQPPVPQTSPCHAVPGLETVFARGDEDVAVNHGRAVEVESVRVVVVDLVAPQDSAVV
jgi:hypothetical protein